MPTTRSVLALLFVAACGGTGGDPAQTDSRADDDALDDDAPVLDAAGRIAPVPTSDQPSPRTSKLYALLARQVTRPSAFFGQQHGSWEGHDGPFDAFDSDIHQAMAKVPGAEATHPALLGWNAETWMNGSAALRERYRQRIIDSDARGGINALHWPMGNFAIKCDGVCGDNDNGEDDQGRPVDPVHLLASDGAIFDGTGRLARAVFDARVHDLAGFLLSLRSADGALIPIILRPFHEMNRESPGKTAHWWAGRDPGEYGMMWRRLVDRLRADGVTNILLAYAPRGELLFNDLRTPEASYQRFWPETDPSTAAGRYVDIAAFDAYLDDDEPAQPVFDALHVAFAFATAPARVVPRVSAIAECGRKDGTGAPHTGGGTSYQNGPFWTERILPGMNASGGAAWSEAAYLMTWTNGTFSTYDGAPAAQADDFVRWVNEPATRFLDEVPAF